ncbi:hypothetical protein F5Y18DRAFT_109641 [Xylariaceae sp. FL1019]|nr:hypothetical protein F5Y18DRAFT_109641 [Xylariaceae sp. FL1019]
MIGGGGGGDPEENCDTPSTVSDCVVVCTPSPSPTPLKSCSTECFGVIGCDITATTTTVTRSTGIPAPGDEWTFEEEWEFQDYAAEDAAWLPLSSSLLYDFGGEDGGDQTSRTESSKQTSQPPTTQVTAEPTTESTTKSTDAPGNITTPYTGSECSGYTTTTSCNGSGGRSACVTQALCMPTAPCPPAYTADGVASCTGDNEICLGTTVFTRCAIETGVAARDVLTEGLTSSAASLATPTATLDLDSLPTPALNSKKPAADGWSRDAVENADLAAWTANLSAPELLFPRQNGCGGSANGGCDYFRSCNLCATITKVPCLQASIEARTGVFSGTDVSAVVNEDGVDVCSASLSCDIWDNDCSGINDVDCGDGNAMSWKWNYSE